MQLGLCNFTVEQLEEYFAVCESKGYVKPAVYQGHYNALVRNHEEQLMPLLRKHNCQYYAYRCVSSSLLMADLPLIDSATVLSVVAFLQGK